MCAHMTMYVCDVYVCMCTCMYVCVVDEGSINSRIFVSGGQPHLSTELGNLKEISLYERFLKSKIGRRD